MCLASLIVSLALALSSEGCESRARAIAGATERHGEALLTAARTLPVTISEAPLGLLAQFLVFLTPRPTAPSEAPTFVPPQ